MRQKSRPVPWLVVEIVSLVLVFAIVIMLGSSTKLNELIDHAEYPRDYTELIEKYAGRYDVDPLLIYSMIKAESDFDPEAVSGAGAIGLMQIMPSTYESDIKEVLGLSDGAQKALRDPEKNIMCGTYYLSRWIKYFGDVTEALAAYNAGPGNVMKWLGDSRLVTADGRLDASKIPFDETRRYVSKVTYYYSCYRDIYQTEGSVSDETTGVTSTTDGGGIPGPDPLTTFIERGEARLLAMKYGFAYRVDFNLVMAIIETESSFRPLVVSSTGAMGLMQIKPDTYSVDIAPNLGLSETSDKLTDAEFNVMCGTYYLQWLDHYLDGICTIAAAYHCGINVVRSWLEDENIAPDGKLTLDSIPDAEVRRYVSKVVGFYNKSVETFGYDAAFRFDF